MIPKYWLQYDQCFHSVRCLLVPMITHTCCILLDICPGVMSQILDPMKAQIFPFCGFLTDCAHVNTLAVLQSVMILAKINII